MNHFTHDACLCFLLINSNIFYHIALTGTTITTFSFFSCDLLQIDLYYDRPKEDQQMKFIEMKNLLLLLQRTDYRNFIKALLAIETNCDDEEKLEIAYKRFMEDDTAQLLDTSLTEKCCNGSL